MLHLIQENLFKEVHYDLLIDTIKKFDLPYKIVRIFPFIDYVVDVEDIPDEFDNVEDLVEINPSGDIWVWGSLKMTRICRDRGWKPGTLLNDNHNYEVYSKWWGDMLLNYDSIIMKISDELPWEIGDLFLRPVEDNKAFTGAVFDKEKWDNTKNRFLKETGFPEFNNDTRIQVCRPKHIQKEIRLWVVGGEIITGSYYRLGGLFYLNSAIEPEAIEFAKKVITKGAIAEAWVLDICMSNNEWKVVEAGCINHAGFYASEIQKTVESIENHFSK